MLSHIPLLKLCYNPKPSLVALTKDMMHTSCIMPSCSVECHASSTPHTIINLCTFIQYILSVPNLPNLHIQVAGTWDTDSPIPHHSLTDLVFKIHTTKTLFSWVLNTLCFAWGSGTSISIHYSNKEFHMHYYCIFINMILQA